jgi:hypothetical protein
MDANKENPTAPGSEQSRVIQMMLAQRAQLVREIARIDRFLKQEGIPVENISSGTDNHWTPEGRPRNLMSKRQVLQKVLMEAATPMSPRELVVALRRAGYVFASADPSNTLNPLLYGSKKCEFIAKVGAGFVHKARKAQFGKPAT